MEEDTVSLPYQQSFSSLKTDSDYIYQVHTPYNHLPLYEPFTAKLSSLKQRTSLYSSAKNNQKPLGKSSYSSQNALDNVPEMQNSRKECSVHSSTPNFSSCMESSPKVFVGTNTLYLDFDNQTTLTPSNIVCCASSSESNLILSPDTAANVDHKLDNTDSDINTSTKCCKSDETDNQSLNV